MLDLYTDNKRKQLFPVKLWFILGRNLGNILLKFNNNVAIDAHDTSSV